MFTIIVYVVLCIFMLQNLKSRRSLYFLYFLNLSPFQLDYLKTLQKGAALNIGFANTEGGHIDLQVGPIIEAAVKLLRPNQANQNVESFYRQKAWQIIQVSVTCRCGFIVIGV